MLKNTQLSYIKFINHGPMGVIFFAKIFVDQMVSTEQGPSSGSRSRGLEIQQSEADALLLYAAAWQWNGPFFFSTIKKPSFGDVFFVPGDLSKFKFSRNMKV